MSESFFSRQVASPHTPDTSEAGTEETKLTEEEQFQVSSVFLNN